MNYFNYFTEIEDAFVRRRGKHLFLSPMDWALMETWKEREIPLHLVLRGVERSFDRHESKPRKRSVKSLLYCQEEVEAQYAEWLEASVGANPPSISTNGNDSSDNSKTPFSSIAVVEHLQRSRELLAHLADARAKLTADELAEALSRASLLLEAIENDFVSGATVDTRKVEDSLTGLERMLNQSLLTSIPTSELEAVRKELVAQFKPYKNQMEPDVYNQTLENMLLKRFREQLGIPRLSLFYL
jgi:hypothetical protein